MAEREPQMSVQTCERLLDHAVSACATQAPPPPAPQPAPVSTSVADSFASLAVAIGWSALVVALIALAAGVAWVWFVRRWAKEEAEKAAKEKLDELMPKFCETWMADNVPQIVRTMQQMASVQTSPNAEGEQETFNPDQVAANAQDDTR